MQFGARAGGISVDSPRSSSLITQTCPASDRIVSSLRSLPWTHPRGCSIAFGKFRALTSAHQFHATFSRIL
jgi:hypothetical protein